MLVQQSDKNAQLILQLDMALRTSKWTSDESCSHADMIVPIHRMESDKTGDKRRVEIMNAFDVLVDVATKVLRVTTI